MSYYQGDFYSGDPGFFSAIGGALKRVIGIGASRAKTVIHEATMPGGAITMGGVRQLPARAGGAIVKAATKHPVLSAAGAAGTIGVLGGGVAGRATVSGSAPHGFHISRKTGRLVRNRRMRVTNVKALHRAIRRATGFAHLARKVLHFTSPKAPRGRAIFKKRRHAKRM